MGRCNKKRKCNETRHPIHLEALKFNTGFATVGRNPANQLIFGLSRYPPLFAGVFYIPGGFLAGFLNSEPATVGF